MELENLAKIEAALGVTGLKSIQGDASTRQYFRCNQGIVMYDIGEGSAQRRAKFVDVSNRLRDAQFCAPKIQTHINELGLILMDDLGGKNLGQAPIDANFKLALDEMLRFDDVNHEGLVHYSSEIYSEELSRLGKFYLKPFDIEDDDILQIAAPYFEELSNAAARFVHVDYHAENLMLCEDGRLGIIDFQDARFGHPLYDLASFVDDIRVDVGEKRAEALTEFAFERLNFKDDDMWLHVLSAQRLLKIIGIFARLVGEGRMGYDQLIPRCFELLQKRLIHPELKEWREWFYDVVPQFDDIILTKLKGEQ